MTSLRTEAAQLAPTRQLDLGLTFGGRNVPPVENDAPAGDGDAIPQFTPNNRYAHLMRKVPRKGANITPLCFFQRTGDCCGNLHNGICDGHLALLNIVVISTQAKIRIGGAVKKITSLVTTALDPFEPNHEAAYTRIFPFIDSPDFDQANFSIGWLDLPSVSTYRTKLERMSNELQDALLYENPDAKLHIDQWVNYMSAKYNVGNKSRIVTSTGDGVSDMFVPQVVPTCVVTVNGSPQICNLYECTLLSQALMGLFIPQIIKLDTTVLSTLTSPAVVVIIDSSICMNKSLLPFGSDPTGKGTIGTQLRSNMVHTPRIVHDEMVSRVMLSIDYTTRKCSK